jgi:CubicO group peptidase (beta-lactamase class C family)
VTAPSVTVHGEVDPRFARVREAFARNFSEAGEVGASCCVLFGGETVVDLHGGIADPVTGAPWRDDTIATVFSSTKGVTAACVNLLIERGVLDPDAPVASYWPEFGREGKERVPLRWALSHRAGVPALDATLTLDECLAWDPVVRAVAAQRPEWEPGTRHGYHARTYGWIAGEVVRRVTGQSLGRFFRDEIAAPLAIDFWIGLPESEEPRVARLVPPVPPADPKVRALYDQFMGPGTLLGRVMTGPSNLFHYDEMWNTRALRAAEMPSSNGIGSARGLARLYAALIGEVDGRRLLTAATLGRATAEQTRGTDAVLGMQSAFGLGFMLPPTLSLAAAPTAFGHPGAGGSLGMADPDRGFALGYVMNRMDMGLTGDPRSHALVAAVYESLG